MLFGFGGELAIYINNITRLNQAHLPSVIQYSMDRTARGNIFWEAILRQLCSFYNIVQGVVVVKPMFKNDVANILSF